MNFLAHAYLSGNSTKLLVGNFIGDFVKGKQYRNLEEEVAQGVLLHRAIDDFTDQHPVVGQSKAKLREKYRHYAGVIVDMAYDHFLASNWSRYHSQGLLEYTKKVYAIIEDHNPILPGRMETMLHYMKQDNWLYQYATLEGIDQALTGMSRRTKFDSKMDEAVIDIENHYQDLKAEFETFLPDAVKFAKEQGVAWH
ncbi:MAG: acyl carrier protein phosphodiesterase [Cytophagales bacterium]|nr:acyl carrier protein phosphodiesterase [Cytophagales bacterium]